MKTLSWELNKLKKLLIQKYDNNTRSYLWLNAYNEIISEYTMAHLDLLYYLPDDILSRNRLYHLANLLGYVPKIKYAQSLYETQRPQ